MDARNLQYPLLVWLGMEGVDLEAGRLGALSLPA
jgi:hypothetical protein